MFRVTPGTDFPAGRASPSPRASTWGGGAAVVAVTLLGLLVTEPAARRAAPGETEVAQRAVAVVAGVYRGEVDIDRRDRTFLLSYADEPVMSADRIAWAVCDSIRSEEVMAALGAGPARLAGGGAACGRPTRLLPDRRHPLIR
jgi:hypothetical protein